MKVSMMLADHAQAVGGKLFICGGGWSVTGPEPVPSAIVLDIKVPWHGINVDHTLRLDLVDADGQPVELETEEGVKPLMIDGTFQATPAPNVKPGTPIDMPVAINLPPQPIPPGGRYEWRLAIDGQTDEDWHVAFTVRPMLQVEAALAAALDESQGGALPVLRLILLGGRYDHDRLTDAGEGGDRQLAHAVC